MHDDCLKIHSSNTFLFINYYFFYQKMEKLTFEFRWKNEK